MFLSKIFSLLSVVCLVTACKEEKKTVVKPDEPKIFVRKDTAKLKKEEQPSRSPIINIVDSIAPKYIVLYVKDSASSSERISQKLAKAYGVKLPEVMKNNKIKAAGPPIAWYRSNKSPFFFTRSMIFSIVNCEGCNLWVTSFHSSGVDTVAPGLGRRL